MNTREIIQICDSIFIRLIHSARYTVTPQWRHNDPTKDFANIVLIKNGEGLFSLGGENKVVRPGDIVFFPRYSKRTMRSNGGSLEFCSINFKYTFINENLDGCKANELPFGFITHIKDATLLSKIEYRFAQIQKQFIAPRYDSSAEIRCNVAELLVMIMMSEKGETTSFSDRNMADDSIKYMSEHFSEKITLSELAGISGKSISYYGKAFKKIIGITPIEYLLHIRIEYSKKLLENGSTVTETANICGFESLYYFSRAFRKREGISPREYAQKIKK